MAKAPKGQNLNLLNILFSYEQKRFVQTYQESKKAT